MAKPNRVHLQLWSLDDRIVPATTPTTSSTGNIGNLNGTSLTNLLNSATAATTPSSTNTQSSSSSTPTATTSTNTSTATSPASPPPPTFASFLPDRGAKPQVQIISSTGTSSATITVFDANYTGGVWAARADVTGDGKADAIAASGPGMAPTVAVFDALDNRLIRTITPYESTFTGGLVIAAVDLDGDSRAEIITGTDQGGGPRVKVYSGLDNSLLADFMAIDDAAFRGGVRVAVGDVNGDGTPELIAAAGFGGGPRVAVFEGKSVLSGTPERLVSDFFAFEPTLRDGVYPSAGKLDSDTKVDLLFGAGPGGAPRIVGVSGSRLLSEGTDAVNSPLVNFFAGLGDSRAGVRIGVVPNSTGIVDILTAEGGGGLVGRYNTAGKLQGTIDRELALSGGLLNDSSGQALTNGSSTSSTTSTNTTNTNTTNTNTSTTTNATLQQLLNSLGLGTTTPTTTTNTNTGNSKSG